MAALNTPAQRTLVISGRATTIDGPERATSVTLLSGCGDTLAIRSSSTGHFHFRVPHHATYVVHFEQAGRLTKEVVVDASQMPLTRNAYRLRHIRFNVLMEEGDPSVHLRYANPVGYIGFRPRSGRVNVVYDYAMETSTSEVR